MLIIFLFFSRRLAGMKTLRTLFSPLLVTVLTFLAVAVPGTRGETIGPSLAAGLAPAASGLLFSQKPKTPAVPSPGDLAALLAKTAEYCRRLVGSAFDFVCREEIRETIDPKLDAAAKSGPVTVVSKSIEGPIASSYLGPTLVISTVRKMHRSFVYDYQCIRAGRAIREIRTELEENGKRKNVPYAELQTSTVVWGTALLGPVGLFGERFQTGYDYDLIGQETVAGVKTVIVDAKPKPGAPPNRNLFGKAWIDPATGDILKIEWSESRVGRFDVFAKRGDLYKRTPRLTIVSEFNVEKNGLRFPSHFTVEEAYLKESGKAFIRSKTDVAYKAFKFFTVEVEVR
jgi:hypothetical protein